MMNGIKEIAESVSSELKHRLPKQRKRTKLALLVSTMLEVRSANLMDLGCPGTRTARGLQATRSGTCATSGSSGCWAIPW
jgi:hypothetical protein